MTLGYISVMIVYIRFKELRNKTGFGLTSLCISLRASDEIMFALAVGHIDKRIYEYVTIILHWPLMNVLSCINIICLELVGLVKQNIQKLIKVFQRNALKA